MREIIARLVCVSTVVVVLALAHVFAARHNPPSMTSAPPAMAETETETATATDSVAAPEVGHGREIYEEQKCSTCHAIAGVGNPRNPLDGVGARRTRAELVEWVTGTGRTADELAPAVVRRKQRYRDLSSGDMDALTDYLASLPPKN